jgi:hypothetical protein
VHAKQKNGSLLIGLLAGVVFFASAAVRLKLILSFTECDVNNNVYGTAAAL